MSADDRQTTLAPELVAAYRAAEYRVHAPTPFVLRVDASSPELAACHLAYGVSASAFLSAWNPGGRPASAEANRAAAERLAAALAARGFASIAGFGADPGGLWPGEDSVLAFGLARPEATALARMFGQNAYLWAGTDAVPRLVLLA